MAVNPSGTLLVTGSPEKVIGMDVVLAVINDAFSVRRWYVFGTQDLENVSAN
jgi:hypothetical protein